MTLTPDQLEARLTSFLKSKTGTSKVELQNVRRLSGGAVHHIWAFDASWDSGEPRKLVVRIDVPGREDPDGMRLEYDLLTIAHRSGVPVPRPLFAGDDTLGTPFFVMEHVDGQTNPGRLVRNEQLRGKALRQLANILARIHAIAVTDLPAALIPEQSHDRSPADRIIDELETRYQDVALDPHPTFELAIRWLRERKPRTTRQPLSLVHGDFRVGNFVYNEDGIAAVLDWEIAHVGDPMEDLGWLSIRFWRFGNDTMHVGGLGSREEFATEYERVGGVVDWDAWAFWEVLGNLRWGIGTMTQARMHLDGHTRSQELAAIGRRTGETELAIL